MRSAANAGCEGKSRLPSRPRNSTAAKPCCSAKVRIFCKSQAGQPKVENAIGRRAVSPAGTNATAIAAPVSFFANSRRVVLMEPRLQQSLAQDYLCAGKVRKFLSILIKFGASSVTLTQLQQAVGSAI